MREMTFGKERLQREPCIDIHSGVRTTRTTSIVTLLLFPPTNRITSSITPSETRTAAASSSRDPARFVFGSRHEKPPGQKKDTKK